MPDHEKPNARGLFGGVFARGGVEAGDAAWLQAMLDAEQAPRVRLLMVRHPRSVLSRIRVTTLDS